ncbi:MAG: aldo/keto reductase [Sulfobacillus acidophilus]|uniref:Aldo/keto reductase n=1 Tax=Sulfobacillus acidophilus TaxID=53633 RepID=A0A2T2WHT9_9FIRM|nr:MAG: aldo/keto reductase [Sulfobacillus acidophilus]
MGEVTSQRTVEVDALRYGIEQGLTVIDTAEMYADGGAEEVVKEAIKDIRNQVFLVTKVWPTHQSREALPKALDASLTRLGTSYVDLYLLHWPSQSVPLEQTLNALAQVQEQGLARYLGVSNFPTPYLKQAQELLPDGATIAADQVEYHLANRRAETALIPYCVDRQIAVMAYTPVKGIPSLRPASAGYRVLSHIAHDHQVSPATIALAYLIGSGPVIAIPKAIQYRHIDANRAALDVLLSDVERQAIRRAFASPEEELPYEAL